MINTRSVRIFLADGTVTGVRHGEIMNWTGQAVASPRTRFPELKEWPEAKRPGVYFLFGEVDDNGQPAVYVGEAENVVERLASHVSHKDFWNEVVLFTSKDENLTKAHVRYLEARIVEMANSAGRFTVHNSAHPQIPALPRSDRDAMEDFLQGVRTLLGVLGYRVLEPLLPSATTRPVPSGPDPNLPSTPLTAGEFELKFSGLRASAIRTDEGMVVRATSEASKSVHSSLSANLRALRDRLAEAGVLVLGGDKLIFSRDYVFPSPSQAAAVIVGYSINGRTAWKTSDGRSTAEIEEDATSGIDISLTLNELSTPDRQ